MRRGNRNGAKKEKVVMALSSVFVLAALTATGLFFRGSSEEKNDGYVVDFSSIENESTELAKNDGEIVQGVMDGVENLNAAETEGINESAVTADDLDYDPYFQETNSPSVENEETEESTEEQAENEKKKDEREERLAPGHRMCAGCGGTIAVRNVLKALHPGDRAVVGNATGCLEVSTYMYPYTAYEDSYIHSAFENAGATLSGVEAAYNALKKRGKIKEEYKFITFGGDGGTYDIGLQSLSGAMERGHDMVYVCYDNGAYMNTGTQRSSATPSFADTTTTPAGKKSAGKPQAKKDLAAVMAAHNIPYVGQTTFIGNMKDLYVKSEKAIYTPGAAFLNVLAPCPRGWRYDAPELMNICKSAVETCYWPLFEVVDGKWILNYEPKKKLPIEDFLKRQGRFKHLFKPENQDYIGAFQAEVDRRWEELRKRCESYGG